MILSRSESKLLNRLIYELDSRTLLRAGFEMHLVLNHDHHDQSFDGPYSLLLPTNQGYKVGCEGEDGSIVVLDESQIDIVQAVAQEENPYASVEAGTYFTLSDSDGVISSEYYYVCYDSNKVDSTFPSVLDYLKLLRLALCMVRKRHLILCNTKVTRSNKEKLAKLPWSRSYKFWFALRNRSLFSDKTHSLESDLEFVGHVGCKLFIKNQDLDELAKLVSI